MKNNDLKSSEAICDLQQKIMSDMIEEFSILTDFQRVELIAKLSNSFCLDCGRKQSSNWLCQCENNE